MQPYSHRWLGVLACTAGIVISALWASGPLNWKEPLALGVILCLALFALLLLLLPLP
jgi:hypothetical protein